MAWKMYLGLVSSAALVGVVASANGCSSSSASGAPHDAGTDVAIHHPDSGSSSGSGDDGGDDGEAGTPVDGTTGKQCTTDADCVGADGGPGINKCTNDGFFTNGQLYPTPVCLIPPTQQGNCDPGNDGNLHFCDGPDDPSSPGVCLSENSANTIGICLPQCNFKPDGSAVTGCVGVDSCNVAGFSQDPNNANAAIGIGYCFGGCTADTDCQTGQKCETDDGLCVTAPVTAAAGYGTGCKQDPTTGVDTPVCDCIASTTSNLGYCSTFCKTGGTACPSGSICDAQLPITLTDSNDASIAGWTAPNPGLAGFCAPTCVVDGGASDEAGACFTNSTCQAGNLGGPDCLP